MREYSEELLGDPEHDGEGPPVADANDELFEGMVDSNDEGDFAGGSSEAWGLPARQTLPHEV
jgi:hypothetical protein